MKKLGVYSLLVAAMLFSTGCSEKNADMNVDSASTNSSANKGTSGLSDAGFSALEKAANGMVRLT
jgi:peptidoglycan-associated lipoprotein